MRREVGIAAGAVAALSLVAGGGLWLYRRLKGADPLLQLPPGPSLESVAGPAAEVSDEPLARETRFDEGLHDEERRRHEAAERLRADPLAEQLEPNGDTS